MSERDSDKIEISPASIWLGSGLAWVIAIVAIFVIFGPGDIIGGSKAYKWHLQKCLVTASSLNEKQDGKGELVVAVQYDYQGKTYNTICTLEGTTTSLRTQADVFMKAGQDVRCRINPGNPVEAMLDAEYIIFEFFLVLVISVTAICIIIPAAWCIWLAKKEQAGWAKARAAAGRIGMGLACVFVFVFCGIATIRGFLDAGRALGTLRWEKVHATVEECSVTKERQGEAWDYKVVLMYRYEYGGTSYSGTRWGLSDDEYEAGKEKRQAVEGMKAGDAVTCYVNPAKPDEAILSRRGASYVGLAALPFLLALAAWGLWAAITQKEEKAATLEAVLPEELAALAVQAQIPVHLHYELGRWQRFVPHMKLWTPIWIIIMGILAISPYGAMKHWWYIAIPAVTVWYWRAFFAGLADILLHSRRVMDVMIEREKLGIVIGGTRLWAWHRDMVAIRRMGKDLWTIQHADGVVINIPASMITDEQVEYLRLAMMAAEEEQGDETDEV